MYNLITLDEAAKVSGISLPVMQKMIADANILPAARLMTSTGLFECYTISAVQTAILDYADKAAKYVKAAEEKIADFNPRVAG